MCADSSVEISCAAGRCVDMCLDVCVDVCVDVCADMCADMCVDECVDMSDDMCVGMCTPGPWDPVYRNVYVIMEEQMAKRVAHVPAHVQHSPLKKNDINETSISLVQKSMHAFLHARKREITHAIAMSEH